MEATMTFDQGIPASCQRYALVQGGEERVLSQDDDRGQDGPEQPAVPTLHHETEQEQDDDRLARGRCVHHNIETNVGHPRALDERHELPWLDTGRLPAHAQDGRTGQDAGGGRVDKLP